MEKKSRHIDNHSNLSIVNIKYQNSNQFENSSVTQISGKNKFQDKLQFVSNKLVLSYDSEIKKLLTV